MVTWLAMTIVIGVVGLGCIYAAADDVWFLALLM